MAGLMMGALGGMGQAAMQSGLAMQKGGIEQDLENIRSENALNKAKALADYNEGANIRSEQRGLMTRETERDMVAAGTVRNAPALSEAQIASDQAKKTAEQGFYDENKDVILSRKRDEAAATRDPSMAKLHKIQTEAAQIDLEYKKLETKLPPGVKARVEPMRDELKVNAAALAKAQAEGTFNMESQGTKDLMARNIELNKKLDTMLSPYYGDKQPKAEEEKAPAGPWSKYGTTDAKKNEPASEPTATLEKKPVDSLKGETIGRLTPLEKIEESARAGNKQAIAYLQRRSQAELDNITAPRSVYEGFR